MIEFGVVRKKDIKWSRGSNGFSTKIPRYITDIAELLEMDPDPYFDAVWSYIFQYC